MISSKALKGFTLVELMIAVAILSVIVVIAIPAYNGYITEARIATAQSNMNSLKLFLEDHRLDNGCYTPIYANGTCQASYSTSSLSDITDKYGWNPRQEDSTTTYSLSIPNTTFYSINVNSASVWVNCSSEGNCTSSY